ncbi:MAG: glutamate-5-semialdehyde dehydrogenase [Candidatus Omnitrophica bacterium]|nr:glutamate-5-semialdehyde dehydrogenase [Candidatus Omnitrophota bacterium]MBU4472726.1 glutamate-5-semialdehyde dehydrogenase [Candidatus Omnitrophota bacterium]MCG2706389.1 glutamate-5-semialdehyde dehydrogenase [Candidatus Omnitrophota bacterium]
MELKKKLTDIAKRAQAASRFMLTVSAETKNEVLKAMAAALLDRKAQVLGANRQDIRKARTKGLSAAFIDRLTLNEKRIKEMSGSLIELTKLPDPVGEVIKAWRRPNGLWIHKVRTPIGVIAIIYESRPNVTADCIGLCFKSGNSLILRGGSEALNSNLSIYQILKDIIKKYGIPEDVISMVDTNNRQAVDILLRLDNYIDLVMPRGGAGLINRVVSSSRIPVIKHYKGLCHIYVDEWADLNMAVNICYNAKVQRPGVCNAMESLLVHKDIAVRFLPGMIKKFKQAGVEIRGCPITQKIVSSIAKAREKDYHTEYLDLILSVKVVEDLAAAIRHINYYGSHHSDSIITDNYENALEFLKQIDSACVYVNASTRFTDGYQFGMGAEIGISTDKLHARGPMALEELTTYKYIVFGSGQIRK